MRAKLPYILTFELLFVSHKNLVQEQSIVITNHVFVKSQSRDLFMLSPKLIFKSMMKNENKNTNSHTEIKPTTLTLFFQYFPSARKSGTNSWKMT